MNHSDEKPKLRKSYLLNELTGEHRQVSAEEQKLLRSYLLGELNEQQREEVEERLVMDEDFFQGSLLVEDDLIDDYVQGELSADERKKFEATILSTPEGRQQVALTRDLKVYAAAVAKKKPSPASNVVQISWWRKPLQSPYFRTAASILIIFSISAVVYWIFIRPSPTDKGLALLKEAYKDQRTLQARISQFDYAPFIKERGNKEDEVGNNKAKRAAELLQTEVDEHRDTADVHHGLGRYYLATKDFDKAIQELNKALEKDPNKAEVHSDLGAALLEKGMSLKDDKGASGIYFAQSLEHLDKALRLNDSLLPALFNRALVREQMPPYDAKDDWQKYLDKDSKSDWADEARDKVEKGGRQKTRGLKTEEEIFQDFLTAYHAKDNKKAWTNVIQNNNLGGGVVENKLITDHLNLSLSDEKRQEAQSKIQMLSYIGELAKSQTGDMFTLELARFYTSLPPLQKNRVRQARKFMKSCQRLLYQSKFGEAKNKYQKAKAIFQETGDFCEEALADYQLGHSYILQTKPQAALSVFEEVSRICAKNNYKWLQSQLFYAMAIGHMALLDYSTALIKSKKSLKMSEESGNSNGIMKAYNQIGLEYLYLNNYQESLNYHLYNLELLKTYDAEPIQRWRMYYSIAQPFNKLGLYSAAIKYQEVAIRIAQELDASLLIWRSYYPLGLMYANQGNYAEGIKNIALAYEISKSLTDPDAQKDAMAQTLIQFGHLYRQKKEFATAIKNYDLAIQIFDESKYGAFTYIAHKGKLLCCLAQGGCPSVEQEIETTLSLFENYRAKILEESNTNIFFDTEQSVYDAIIDFEYSRKEEAAEYARLAFEFSERSRARSLLNLITATAQVTDSSRNTDLTFESKVKGLADIQANLSDNSQILQYAVLEKRVLIWVISKNEFHYTSYDIHDAKLNERVSNYLSLIKATKKVSKNNVEELLHESEYLHTVLVSPAELWLDKSKQICIVPDKILNFIPFAALVSPSSKRYLLQDHTLQLSSSATIFILSSNAAKEKEAATDERLFSVGDPAFDHSLFSLDELEEAADEANAIKSLYNHASISLIGAKATKHHVESEIEKSDVAHFALHAITHESTPLLSKLILAPEQIATEEKLEDSGVLTCQEIYNLNLTRPKLVVLSACQTAVERYYGGEGMIGIARPFIAKRIPLVVASLWSVNSEPTKDLMITFHKYRKEAGLSTVEALRQAQLDMLTGSNKTDRLPYHWAAFITIGGYARF